MRKLSLYTPSRIYCSPGALWHLGEALENLGNRFLLITEASLSASPEVDKIREGVEKGGGDLMVFNDIPSRADSRSAETAAELVKVSRLHGVIGFGGLRALGIAKLAAYAGLGEKRVDDLLSGTPFDGKSVPYIEIPGAVRSPFMLTSKLFTVDARDRSPRLIQSGHPAPYAVCIDPVLWRPLSAKYRVALLLDLLLLSVEGYLGGTNTFYSETCFLKAIALSLDAITALQSNKESSFEEAASQASFFNALGGASVDPGMGTALAWSISSFRQVPKSVTSSILLPHILENGLKIVPDKVARLGNILGENLKGLSVIAAADRTVESLRSSIGSQQLPGRLEELGIKKSDFPDILSRAEQLPFTGGSSHDLYAEGLEKLLEQAW